MDEGFVLFKGAASFINNEKSSREGGTGAGMFSSSQLDEPMVFLGPVLFKGNVGLVSGDSFQQFKHVSEVSADDSFMLRTTVLWTCPCKPGRRNRHEKPYHDAQ